MAEPHQAKGFNTANLEPRETRGNPGVGACNLLSVSVFFPGCLFFGTSLPPPYPLLVCHSGLALLLSKSLTHVSASHCSVCPTVIILINIVPLCHRALHFKKALSLSPSQTHTHTHPNVHKQPGRAEKLLQRASQYKPWRHILLPKFMSCYRLRGRERT